MGETRHMRGGQGVGADDVLRRFRAVISKMYGARLDKAVLFGSRARGDARSDSDYDVAVFLTSLPDRWAELDRLADMSTDILYDLGAVVHALPFPVEAYDTRTPLMLEVRSDGIDL